VSDEREAPGGATRRKSKVLGVAVRVAATLAVFAALFWKLPAANVWAAMSQTPLAQWAAIFVAFGAVHAVGSSKWRMLVRAAGIPLDTLTALRAHAAGLFANIWLPSIIGGDVVRATWISRSYGGIAVPALAGIADRALDLGSLIALGALGAFFAPADKLGPAAPILRAGAIAFVIAGLAGLALLYALPMRWLPARAAGPFARVREVLGALAARPGTTAASFALALFTQGSFVALNAWLGASIGLAPGAPAWLLAWPLSKVVAMVGFTLGGLGVRETALAVLLAPFGVPPTLALAQGLVWQSVLFAFGVLAGAWAWLGRSDSPR
jgi:glycosyltransferase 2 family protein